MKTSMSSKEQIQNDSEVILRVDDLKVHFHDDRGTVKAVDGVSFKVKRGKVLGIIGESGSGKTITALSLLRLSSQQGNIYYYPPEKKEPVNLSTLDHRSLEMRNIRGAEIAMIFQEPMTSFNPVYTIGQQIVEMLITHRNMGKKEAEQRAMELLDRVTISNPKQRVKEYPHQLSGGMRQRAMIAMAMACNPKLLIADEPTTALDVTIQAQIMSLLKELQAELKMSIILVSHNMGVISEMSQDVLVMYMGKMVEQANLRTIFRDSRHPYTVGLLQSIPWIGEYGKRKLVSIEGGVPNPYDLPEGCVFRPRCLKAFQKCLQEPPIFDINENHQVKCWLYE